MNKPIAARQIPELLAPAGDWDCARAAVENGADAIYFGLEKFNARMRSQNFQTNDLPELVSFLHSRGVKGYLTFNTLVFPGELEQAETFLRAAIAAGVDAAIVQDVGLCRMIREISPDFPIHASTQMSVTSAEGVRFAERLGCQLVVLARELSIQEINSIQGILRQASAATLPLEIFVHGALCVAYSGQCLTSESLGGRSANRGECAQACRMPYELVRDGKEVELGDRRYLLSPQDLAGLDVLPDLVQSGVSSLKIEGRLKSPEYVASVTQVYRRALDRLMENGDRVSKDGEQSGVSPEDRYQLEMSFSRGLYTGWFRGINNQELAHARFGKKRGVYLGQVDRVESDKAVWVQLEAPLAVGDGVVFDQGRPDQNEAGGRVRFVDVVQSRGKRMCRIGFDKRTFPWGRIRIADKIWKTSDPAWEKAARQSFEGDKPKRTQPVWMEVHGRVDEPLMVEVRDTDGRVWSLCSESKLDQARNQPLTPDRLEERLGRLGGTEFHLEKLNARLQGDLILPLRELNELRRRLVEILRASKSVGCDWEIRKRPAMEALSARLTSDPADTDGGRAVESPQTDVEWSGWIRRLDQLEALAELNPSRIYLEFEDPKKYRDAMNWIREKRIDATWAQEHPLTVWVAAPRIFKPGEEWILRQVLSCEADGYLVRNYDHLKYFEGRRLMGDFSLNVANPWTAEYFIKEYGLERLTASYDLNEDQLMDLLRMTPTDWLEITLHQRMPMFHMEHCVFCAFLSSGKDYRDCGRPCEKHEVQMKDRVGQLHPLTADAGCRNTLYNAQAQTGAESFQLLKEAGARSFRLDFLSESPEEIRLIWNAYQRLASGKIAGEDLWREFKWKRQLGVTRGTMKVNDRVTP